jgi:hypothetical protein
MLARRTRAAAVAAVSIAALLSTACVRGRNDGGLDAAGNSSNGAGPAPQPGPLGGENRDTTMLPAAAPAAPAGAPANAPAAVPAPAATGTKAP